jgi:hypothetical protein
MTSAPLTGFCNVDLAFGDHVVLGKLSFEIGGAIVYVVVPFGRGKPRRCASAAGLIAPPGRGVRRKWAGRASAPPVTLLYSAI